MKARRKIEIFSAGCPVCEGQEGRKDQEAPGRLLIPRQIPLRIPHGDREVGPPFSHCSPQMWGA